MKYDGRTLQEVVDSINSKIEENNNFIKEFFGIKTPVKKKTKKTLLRAYRRKVWKITEQNVHQLEGVDKRGWKNHHVDHKISVWWGWKHNIPEEHIAHIDNLRMLCHKKNMKKGTKCHIDDKNEWICK